MTYLILLAEAKSSDAKEFLGVADSIDLRILCGSFASFPHIPLIRLRKSGRCWVQRTDQAAKCLALQLLDWPCIALDLHKEALRSNLKTASGSLRFRISTDADVLCALV